MNFDPKIQVEVDPNEDTEWNDILRAQGIIPEKEPDPSEQVEEALQEALKKQHENRLEGKTLDELDELEDEEDEDFLNEYRLKRMVEMQKMASKAKFGDVYGVNKPEYKREVTDASKDCYVVVEMSNGNMQSRILSNSFKEAAHKYPEIKFVEIVANRAVENYPDSNCPTLLVYHDGDVLQQFVTLSQLAGNQTGTRDLENVLVDVGAVKEKDSRLLMNQDEDEDEGEHHLRFMKNKPPQVDEDEDFFD